MDLFYYGVNQLSNYKECFRKGLLQKVKPSKDKCKSSIEKAEQWLEEAEKNIESFAFDSCLASSYMATFHASRAILFRDGIREKSHFCIARYLEKYVKDNLLEEEWVVLLDRMRDIRHMNQYTLQYHATDEEASSCLHSANEFVNRMKCLFKETH